MTRKKKILFSLAVPILLGIVILLSFVSTCQRFEPELILEITTDSIETLPGGAYKLTGSVVSFGQEKITQHGFCWSESRNPTTEGAVANLGPKESKGSFTYTINYVDRGTTFFIRAFAETNDGIKYGIEKSLVTPAPGLPTLTTAEVIKVIFSSAQGGGNVIDDGGAEVTARGVCWSTFENPTLSDNITTDGTGTGSYTSSMTGLTLFTRYYVRAYAINSAGIAYGDEVNFRTQWDNSTITDYDGNVYNTIQIGDQVWMQENLKVTRSSVGSPISYVAGGTDWDSLTDTDKAYCWYDNNSSNGETYGLLYTWAASMNGASTSSSNPSEVQGVCPNGWHLPSDTEWKQLEMHLGMSQAEADDSALRGTTEGGKLKETGTTHWISPNTGATNESGFTALPGGTCQSNGSFVILGTGATFWTASEGDATVALYRGLGNTYSEVRRVFYKKNSGFSVRCVKD